MKKLINRLFSLLVIIILFTFITSCNNNDLEINLNYSNDLMPDLRKTLEYSYNKDFIAIPNDIPNKSNYVVAGDSLYFSSEFILYADTTFSYTTSSADIYAVNIDGSDIIRLPEYKPPVKIPEKYTGGYNIEVMTTDNDGNLWVAEKWDIYIDNTPADYNLLTDVLLTENEGIQDFGAAIRMLDVNGMQLKIIDISNLHKLNEQFDISALGISNSYGEIDIYIYIAIYDWQTRQNMIYVLDSSGNKLFEVSTDSRVSNFITLNDGIVAYINETLINGEMNCVIQTIDITSKSIGRFFTIPTSFNKGILYPGTGQYDVVISDDIGIHGFIEGNDYIEELLNWLDNDIINNIKYVTLLSDNKILCVNQDIRSRTYEVVIFTKTQYNEQHDKIVLTLATIGHISDIQNAVIEFNRTNTEYNIIVNDYSQYNTEGNWNVGHTRLATEIITGNYPDIIVTNDISYNRYAANGVFTNLYQYIDSDPELCRDDFIDSILRSAEINGELYQLFSSFSIQTLFGHPSVLGRDDEWSLEEFHAVLAANPNADIPLAQWVTKTPFLRTYVSMNIDDFINWADGTVSFDVPEFEQLILTIDLLPDDIWDVEWTAEQEAIATGRQIMSQIPFNNIDPIYLYYKALYGGDIVLKGFPSNTKNGSAIRPDIGFAIIKNSPNKDAAWTFLRMILSEEWQVQNTKGFPTNKEAYNRLIQDTLEIDYTDRQVEFTQDDADMITIFINSITSINNQNMDDSIWHIINEEVSDYYNGINSIHNAIKNIQSRVTILVSERS